jgi:hypothetical protein
MDFRGFKESKEDRPRIEKIIRHEKNDRPLQQ